MSGGKETGVITEDGRAPRLVESDPVLHLGKSLEHGPGVVLKVKGKLLAVKKTTISLVQTIGEIPMEQCDEGRNSRVGEVIDELDVMVDTRLVDGVVPAAEGDDSAPRDGESVGGGAELLEEGDVLAGAVVRVAGYGAGAAVGDLAGDGAEGVPDGGATTVFFTGAFDLVTRVWGDGKVLVGF